MADRGVNIFDQAYKEIPGSNPKRYTTAYDNQCDARTDPHVRRPAT